MKKEIWKPVKGYEELYEVSNLGRVKSLDRKDSKGRKIKGKIRKEIIKNGYKHIGLSREGERYFTGIHRLVAQAFISNPNNLPEVNHEDGDKNNNTPENLKWCTRQYNIQHAYDNGLNKGNIKSVYQYTLDGEFINEYESVTQAEKTTGIPNSDICQASVPHGSMKSAGGYQWRFTKHKRVSKYTKYKRPGLSIKQYDLNGNFINEFESINNAAKQTGVNSGSIYACYKGKQKQAGGFIWK